MLNDERFVLEELRFEDLGLIFLSLCSSHNYFFLKKMINQNFPNVDDVAFNIIIVVAM